jgi:hypothetical protein
LDLCKARDTKRKQFEAEKQAKLQHQPEVKTHVTKPKANAPVTKPLTYEELMSRAEKNSKNTLSMTDLKAKTGSSSIVREAVKSENNSETKCHRVPTTKQVPNKASIPKSVSVVQKKPVKVIKRNMKPSSEVSDLVVLNQRKRDLRSIEEIQLELKQRPKPEIKQKEPKTAVDPDKEPEKYYAKNYSSIISNLFGYDRNKFSGNDEDDLSDMEADYSTVMAEEARSSRLGKQEDLEEELKEIERKKRKAALLKSRMNKK